MALASGIFGFTSAAGLTGSNLAAAPIAVLIAVLVGLAIWKRPIVALESAGVPPGLRIVSGVATLVALVQLARLAVFIVAPSQVAYSTLPSSGWEVTHSCTSAYFVAARAADEASVYDDSLYSLPGDPTARRKARVLDGFRIDVFEYPPPFLLLPRALRLAVPEFLRFRMLWFGLCGGFLLLAMLLVARALGPPAQARALLLVPIVWAAFPVVNCLQKGNLQLVVIAAAMLGMLLIDRRRPAAGGATWPSRRWPSSIPACCSSISRGAASGARSAGPRR